MAHSFLSFRPINGESDDLFAIRGKRTVYFAARLEPMRAMPYVMEYNHRSGAFRQRPPPGARTANPPKASIVGSTRFRVRVAFTHV
jgi:hypothetical protein